MNVIPAQHPLSLKLVSWNVGGLNGTTRKYKIKELYYNSQVRPDILAIQEHKLDEFAISAVGNPLSRDLRTVCSPGQKGMRGNGWV